MLNIFSYAYFHLYILLSEKSFDVFSHFPTESFEFLLLTFESSLDMSPSLDMWLASILSQPVAHLFILLTRFL